MSVARVNQPAPEFALPCVRAGEERARVARRSDYAGRWLAVMFYPRDFTFVCPTELTAFSARIAEFHKRDCDLLGVSVDTIELHREWLAATPAEGGVGPLGFPLASDTDGAAARAFGVWVEEKQVSTRGLFLIDREGVLQYSVIHNLNVGRSPDEVLRVLDALRTGALCPASWTSADGTIDPEKALKPGAILGHYRIRQRLGGGTFGTVFAAWDLSLERMVALKVLRRSLLESREAALAEARAAARLSHPNVCTVHAVEEIEGLPVIVMEYLQGRPLDPMAAEGLPPQRALELARQIATGLAAAHQREVVHGDLKPANVIVTGGGAVKLLDFGLAGSLRPDRFRQGGDEAASGEEVSVADAADDATVDLRGSGTGSSGGVSGTPAYMSPEQAAGLAPGPASDVFSFALVLVEMLTGRRALRGQTAVKLILRLQGEELGPEIAAGVDAPLRELVAAMLARDPARRPSMEDVARNLTHINL